ncbi:MAG: sel1 repeat family protein [Proteobacteria bacterium]|nr:sel1 repeat family protein [Pseudomonadota bacterium]
MVGWIALILAIFFGLAAAPAQAGPELAQGEAAYKSKHYAGAYLLLLPLGQQGDKRAQFLLGRMSDNGLGPIQLDPREALRWYRMAADQGYGPAQFAMAQAYAFGRGVTPSAEESLAWLRRAAENGQVRAMLSLAALYDDGRGVPKDPATAAQWVRRAAERSADAQRQLAQRLEEGRGIAANPQEAAVWLRRAAAAGNAEALFESGRRGSEFDESTEGTIGAYVALSLAAQRSAGDVKRNATQERARLQARMTPPEVGEAQARIKAWKAAAAQRAGAEEEE